jgi:hypothetical protein
MSEEPEETPALAFSLDCWLAGDEAEGGRRADGAVSAENLTALRAAPRMTLIAVLATATFAGSLEGSELSGSAAASANEARQAQRTTIVEAGGGLAAG